MKALILPVLVGFVFLGLQNCKSVDVGEPGPGAPMAEDTTGYSCMGKTRCTEMKSCAEAQFYLKNCPGVEIDGDGDGVPCEDQFCG